MSTWEQRLRERRAHPIRLFGSWERGVKMSQEEQDALADAIALFREYAAGFGGYERQQKAREALARLDSLNDHTGHKTQ